jgi:hypothetical protein
MPIAALAAVTAGCLPRGEPPVGRQILADRQANLVGLLPPTGDGVIRAFVTRPAAQPPTTDIPANFANDPIDDLFEISVDATGGPPTETLLVPNIDGIDLLGCGFNVAPCSGIGARMLIVVSVVGGQLSVDALTGQVQPLAGYGMFSPDRQRFFVNTSIPGSPRGTLYDGEGGATTLDDASSAFFIGNDLFYVTSAGDVMDVGPSGVLQRMATGVDSCIPQNQDLSATPGVPCIPFVGQETPDGTALMLHMQAAGPNGESWAVRDPLTTTQTWLPFDGSEARLSPDDRWFFMGASNGSGDLQFTFFDYRAGVQKTGDVSVSTNFPAGADFLTARWRPGTEEVWINTGFDTPTVWILAPDQPPASIPGFFLYGFTPDGTYWLSQTSVGETATPVIQVGAVDDPGGARFDLNTSSTYVDQISQFADGTLMVPAYTKLDDEQERIDVSVVDPRTGASRLLAQRGRLAAVGTTRMMGMFHWNELRGDLTVADPSSGVATVLAPEFTTTAFAEPRGDDLLAPGAPIVYQFQARTASPYDGIWLTSCP